ncbi:hypothetical protein Sjap_017379 [Stephania japonica]|uniref:Uncharacterized protein n=1 Tax=Stephania japonica TaxID=461633 RepID=A0AAP0I623_9MAGN
MGKKRGELLNRAGWTIGIDSGDEQVKVEEKPPGEILMSRLGTYYEERPGDLSGLLVILHCRGLTRINTPCNPTTIEAAAMTAGTLRNRTTIAKVRVCIWIADELSPDHDQNESVALRLSALKAIEAGDLKLKFGEAVQVMKSQANGGHIFNMDSAGYGGSSAPLTAKADGINTMENKVRNVVDVRDVAEALLLRYEKPEAEGRCVFKEVEEEESKVSSAKMQRPGWKFRPVEETLADSVKSY